MTDIALPALLKAAPAVTVLIGSNPMRCYPAGQAIQNPTLYANIPLVTFFTVFSIPENYVSGAPTMDHVRYQLNAWAKTYDDALALFKACRAALEGDGKGVWVDTGQDGFDQDVKLFYVLGHIEFWVQR